MFDRDRLFRVLFHLSTENNDFLVAQDAYETIRSCIHQIRDASIGLSEMKERLKLLDESEEYTTRREQIQSCIERYEEVQRHEESWISFLNPLLEEAREFWFCCPVDHTHCVGENKSPVENWTLYKDRIIPEEIILKLKLFQNHCSALIHSHFSDLVRLLQEEIEREKFSHQLLTNKHSRLANFIPLALIPQFYQRSKVFLGSTMFPRSHNHHIDPNFASLLGYSVARILCFPAQYHVVNFHEKIKVSQVLESSKRRLTSVQFFYRTASRDIVAVQLEISPSLYGVFYALGVNITQEIEESKTKYAQSIEKMLKQWLHSIRNASFEQQARVILEEVQNLEKKVHRSELQGEFESISECVKLLIHTARTSVGLIDQALETRGLTQHMCVSDFASNITSFPHHFAHSEGIPTITTRYQFFLNGNKVTPQQYSSLFVTGDVISLQSLIDNILSNAVRYTDPILGIFVSLSIDHQLVTKLNFILDITDFSPGGLPSTAMKFLQDNLGSHKCFDHRTKDKLSQEMISKGRSSRTGLPHMVEICRNLSSMGNDDFNLIINTSDSGTTMRIQILLSILDQQNTSLPHDPLSTTKTSEMRDQDSPLITGTVLVVDDSMVIRKMISRYLQTFQCTHKVCSDGAEAWDWFVANHSYCAGVITDLEMPKMGGDALICKIQELCPGKPCFIVSGNNIPLGNLPVGAIRAIVKPISVDQVESILCEIHLTQQSTDTRTSNL